MKRAITKWCSVDGIGGLLQNSCTLFFLRFFPKNWGIQRENPKKWTKMTKTTMYMNFAVIPPNRGINCKIHVHRCFCHFWPFLGAFPLDSPIFGKKKENGHEFCNNPPISSTEHHWVGMTMHDIDQRNMFWTGKVEETVEYPVVLCCRGWGIIAKFV